MNMGREHRSFPHLRGRDARQTIAEERSYIDRYERQEIAKLIRAFSPAFKSKAADSAARVELLRVTAIIAGDRAEHSRELARAAAEIEVADGKFANLIDLEERPTPEQIAQAERDGAGFERVAEVGSGRDARAGASVYRRRDCPQAWKLMFAGVIDREGFAACCWYRSLYETTGLSGNVRSADLAREVFAAPEAKAMFADWQVEQQDLYRFVRAQIEPRRLRLLDQVALHDVPLNRAVRAARAFHRRRKPAFAEAVEELASARGAASEKN